MDYTEIAQTVVADALKWGADQSDVYLVTGSELTAEVRSGEIEKLTQSRSKGLGVRVYFGKRMGFGSTTDFSPASLQALVRAAADLAREADERSENGLPETHIVGSIPDLQIYDPTISEIGADEAVELARRCESAASGVDHDRIRNSEGNGYIPETHRVVLANSNGLCASFVASSCAIYAQPVAEEDGQKQTDFDFSFSHFRNNLRSPEEVGQMAGRRALRRLGGKRPPTARVPVIFDRRVAAYFLSDLASAVNGDMVYKGMSFLKDCLGKKIASDCVTVDDDGTVLKAPGSAPFDGEGLPTRCNRIIQSGELRLFLYDAQTARKAGAQTTGNARRGYGSPPGIGPFNLYLHPGKRSPEDLIAGISSGLYVTGAMSAGSNPVTGDFSFGVNGMWIENGELTYPVEEGTVAGNLRELLMNIEEVASDLVFESAIASPTLKVTDLTVGGESD